MIVGRILGWTLIAVAIAVAGLGLWLWIAGHEMGAVAGQLWFQLDAGSLNLTQSIIQRYLHPALWDGVFVPLLRWPAYLALGVSALAPAGVGALLVALLRRRRRGRRRLFR